ncbi:unnamed protein product [Hymenolepis diminuta]|uniref:BZIP domain-containing protein n=1 Tax=Hymenolepis diminuta TaxID=6216 RepID=A0A0R3SSW6_HYMDI|nr:unnamed protein product [Hymenolepis diminuta]VUZ53045.1 unnamed protein product [Hymenolepis diminuta]
MGSNYVDPGLFDAPISSASARPGSTTSSQCKNSRRIYRPVPEDKRRSVEYIVSRQRNNKAVRLCRANTKVRQDSMRIKAEGYQALTVYYKQEAAIMKKYLMQLQQLVQRRVRSREEFNDQLQALFEEESAERAEFEARGERIRQMYAERVRNVIDGNRTGQPPTQPPSSSTSPLVLENIPDPAFGGSDGAAPTKSSSSTTGSSLSSNFSSQSSLKTLDPFSTFPFSPLLPQ